MANVYSVEYSKLVATPPKKLATTELGGRLRIGSWKYVVPAGNQAINDLIFCTRIPAGSRLISGRAVWEAMSTGGAAASVQIGDGTTANRFLDTTSVDAAGNSSFLDQIVLDNLADITVDTDIIAKVLTEAWAATKKFYGHVIYVHEGD